MKDNYKDNANDFQHIINFNYSSVMSIIVYSKSKWWTERWSMINFHTKNTHFHQWKFSTEIKIEIEKYFKLNFLTFSFINSNGFQRLVPTPSFLPFSFLNLTVTISISQCYRHYDTKVINFRDLCAMIGSQYFTQGTGINKKKIKC